MEEEKRHRYRPASAIKQGFDQLQRVLKSDEIKQFVVSIGENQEKKTRNLYLF